MPTPRVMVLRAPGTNCDQETVYAFQLAQAEVDAVHINRWLENPRLSDQYQILCIPGGFSYGDDLGAGRIFAFRVRHHVAESLLAFKESGKLILGICNGFQVLVQTALLWDEAASGEQLATLTTNDSGHFEDRWVHLVARPGHCVFLHGVERLELPVAHAEGKFVARDAQTLANFAARGQLVLRFASRQGSAAQDEICLPYPDNPNGSQANTAGMCDRTGRVFGLMPHPERFVQRTQHPQWTRRQLPEKGDGLAIFENAVRFFA